MSNSNLVPVKKRVIFTDKFGNLVDKEVTYHVRPDEVNAKSLPLNRVIAQNVLSSISAEGSFDDAPAYVGKDVWSRQLVFGTDIKAMEEDGKYAYGPDGEPLVGKRALFIDMPLSVTWEKENDNGELVVHEETRTDRVVIMIDKNETILEQDMLKAITREAVNTSEELETDMVENLEGFEDGYEYEIKLHVNIRECVVTNNKNPADVWQTLAEWHDEALQGQYVAILE